MFSFIKKIISGIRGNHDVHDVALLDEDDFDRQFQQHSIEQQQSFVDQHESNRQQFEQQNQSTYIDQALKNMHDPYMNPGQDIVVNEHYHGMDHESSNYGHDIDNSFHNHNDHDMHHDFDTGGHDDHF